MNRNIKTQSSRFTNLNQTDEDDYKSILIKLIPSEIVAAYVTCVSLIYTLSSPQKWHWAIIIFLTFLTPIYLYKISKVIKINQLIYSTIGFIVWAFSIKLPLITDETTSKEYQILISVILIIYTLLLPLFFLKKRN